MLDGRPLIQGLSSAETAAVRRVTDRSLQAGRIVRLRVRDLTRQVVFSDDGSGFKEAPEDEAIDAAHGREVTHLTRLNTDRNDAGPAGEAVVEVYQPLTAGTPGQRVGVLEVYLPYAPIRTDIASGLRTMYLVLGIGLATLWAVLATISASTTRRLRREADRNAYLADHDVLTSLPNRALFRRRAEAAIEDAQWDGGSTAIVVADLDRFKEVNDTLGHHYDAGKLALVAELRRAIEAGELLLHYQPKAVVTTGQIRTVEALVRWQHPRRGLLYPGAFLPIAEQTGLIEPLTRWVLRTALEQLHAWGAPADRLAVAVNISARSVARHDFADLVLGTLAETGVPADRLLLGITETALLADPAAAATVLSRLSRAGVNISIDDFGQGHTSLGYLSSLPLHELKIDKSFVMDIVNNPSHAAIVRSVVELGHNLGLKVVAEGVETEEARAYLASIDCDVAQGYLIAKPMPADQLPEWLTAQPADTRHPARTAAP